MTQLLADPAHWRLRAQQARQRAKQLDDPEAKALQSKMADKYEDLAARAEEWMNKHEDIEDIPQFLKSGPSTAP